jgi:hypothetical protein
VEYGDGVEYGRDTPAFPLAGDGTVSIPVLGLTPDATSHLRVCLDDSGGPAGCTADQVVVTKALPGGFPTFTVASSAAPPSGYLLIGAVGGVGAPIWSVVLGADARIYWYASSGTQPEHGFELNRTPLGAFLVYRSDQGLFDEVDLSGRSLHQWRVPGTDGANGHAIYPLDADRMLMMSYGHDGSGSFDSFDTLTRDGQVQFHWQTPSHPASSDTYHPNSFTFDKSGTLLASLRNVDTVLALDFSSAQTLWRLGGTMSDYTFVGDPLGGFNHQHAVSILPDGHVLAFDNGNGHTPQTSRVVEYTLDPGTKTAALAWQYQHSPPVFCPAGGSAERLSDGTTMIVWSFGGLVDSVAPDGTLLWELRAGGAALLYRGHWVTSIYP